MKKAELIFDGIKRAGSNFNPGSGACDLVQNLRYEYGRFEVAERKKEIFSDPYTVKVYRHTVNAGENIICVRQLSDGVSQVDIHTAEGFVTISSYSISAEHISVATLGNLLVVLVGEYNLYAGKRIETFAWNNDAYSKFSDGTLPEMPDISISYGNDVELSYESIISGGSDVSAKILLEYVNSHLNRAMHIDNDLRTEGYILVSIDYTLFDNTRTKQSAPIMFRISENGYKIVWLNKGKNTKDIRIRTYMTVQSAKLKIQFPDGFYNSYKDIIKAINVYVSYSKSSIDAEKTFLSDKFADVDGLCKSEADDSDAQLFFKSGVQPKAKESSVLTNLVNEYYKSENGGSLVSWEESYFVNNIWSPAKPFTVPDVKDLHSEEELLYQIHNVPMADSGMDETVDLKFGEEVLSGRRMAADSSGYIRYFGKALAFNSRVHLYSLYNTISVETGAISWWGDKRGHSYSIKAIVTLKENGNDLTTFHEFPAGFILVNADEAVLALQKFISYPDSRAYKVTFHALMDDGKVYSGSLPLYPSPAYNYAYSTAGGCSLWKTDSDTMPDGASVAPWYESPCDIIVSGQSNPLVFPANGSYRMNGEITAILPMSDAVSEAQFGQFPLAVFTTDGIYVLQQGNGEILYSNIVKINDIKCSSGSAISTKTGIYFHSEDGIFILSGRNVKRISAIVEGRFNESLFGSDDYNVCMNNEIAWKTGNEWNAPVTMRDIIMYGAPVLSYDSLNDELIVSADEVDGKSLVYCVKTGLWREDGLQSLFYANGLSIIHFLDHEDSSVPLSKSVCDMESLPKSDYASMNKAYPVCVMTRVLRLSDGYSSIHRLIARGLFVTNRYGLDNTGKNTSSMISLYVFVSDDLVNWQLSGACQTDETTDKLQIMKLQGSHKYHVIALAGYAKPGTEFSHFDIMLDDRYTDKIR